MFAYWNLLQSNVSFWFNITVYLLWLKIRLTVQSFLLIHLDQSISGVFSDAPLWGKETGMSGEELAADSSNYSVSPTGQEWTTFRSISKTRVPASLNVSPKRLFRYVPVLSGWVLSNRSTRRIMKTLLHILYGFRIHLLKNLTILILLSSKKEP